MRLVVASRNEHKLRELRGLLAGCELVPLPDDVELPPETGATFADNALIKARAAAAATGLPAIADDSGIEASALGGAPGVRSARYAGEDATDQENLDKLLREVPPDGVDTPPEDGRSYADNALIKARAAAAATGRAAVADDSGIEAQALGGAPGVRSARYAGEEASDQENLDKLLREVTPDSDPRLAYVCVLAHVAGPEAEPVLFEGRCTGTITHEPRGENGFGYDPCFVPDDRDDGLTMAELDPADKDLISHRGRAAHAFADWLRASGEAAA